MEYAVNANWQDIAYFKPYAELQAYIKGRGLEEMSNPSWVNLATDGEERARKFKKGDKVRIINDTGEGIECLGRALGEVARVAHVRRATRSGMDIGIEFEEYKGWTHSLGGELDNCNGYWVYPHNIELVEEDEELDF